MSTSVPPTDPSSDAKPPRSLALIRSEGDIAALPASERIRYRLVGADCRFHANDNISEYIRPGETEELKAEVAEHMQAVLRALVIDTDSTTTRRKPPSGSPRCSSTRCFAAATSRCRPSPSSPTSSRLNELMIVGPISVRSACSHHMCPILGRIWIGVLPNEHSNLIGLSKYSRIVDWIMTRPQIQEEAVTMLANVLQERVKPDGLAIVMEADHFCMQWRGVKDLDSAMTNSVMRGAFLKDPHLRREFLSLLSKKNA